MDKSGLIIIIQKFQQSVKEVVDEFYNAYGRTDLLVAVRSDKLIPVKGKLNAKVYKYAFHGVGLYAKIKGKEIDFDFGTNDRIDGFDAWRLNGFLNSQKAYKGLWSLKELEIGLKELENEKIIFKPDTFSGSSNYYFNYV